MFQIDCVSYGAWMGTNSLPRFDDKVPHYTTTFKPLASVKYHFCHSLPVVNIQKFTRK
jgi:hypothetical protein